jgi:putative effector of murein hydrolase LrgA (UPF0299 family)
MGSSFVSNEKTLDAGLWMLDGIRNFFFFIPAEVGIFDQHRALSIQYLAAYGENVIPNNCF